MVSDDPVRTGGDVRTSVAAELSASGFEDAEEIGHGGFGVVYRCRQVVLDRTVAVKVLTAELDADNRARFFREQQAMGRLTGHPNIVTVLQVRTNVVAVSRWWRSFCGSPASLCLTCARVAFPTIWRLWWSPR